MKLLNLFYILSSIVFFSTPERPSFLEGDYVGSWGRTIWYYQFQKDGTFLFESNGHFGNIISSGTYYLIEDTLILNSYDSLDKTPRLINEPFILDGDSCIIDKNGYDYCKVAGRFLFRNSIQRKI